MKLHDFSLTLVIQEDLQTKDKHAVTDEPANSERNDQLHFSLLFVSHPKTEQYVWWDPSVYTETSPLMSCASHYWWSSAISSNLASLSGRVVKLWFALLWKQLGTGSNLAKMIFSKPLNTN